MKGKKIVGMPLTLNGFLARCVCGVTYKVSWKWGDCRYDTQDNGTIDCKVPGHFKNMQTLEAHEKEPSKQNQTKHLLEGRAVEPPSFQSTKCDDDCDHQRAPGPAVTGTLLSICIGWGSMFLLTFCPLSWEANHGENRLEDRSLAFCHSMSQVTFLNSIPPPIFFQN